MLTKVLLTLFLMLSGPVWAWVQPHYVKYADRLRKQHIGDMRVQGLCVNAVGGGLMDVMD